jgi:hypothetical protein
LEKPRAPAAAGWDQTTYFAETACRAPFGNKMLATTTKMAGHASNQCQVVRVSPNNLATRFCRPTFRLGLRIFAGPVQSPATPQAPATSRLSAT